MSAVKFPGQVVVIADGDTQRLAGASQLDHIDALDLLYANWGIAKIFESVIESQADSDTLIALASAQKVVAAALLARMQFAELSSAREVKEDAPTA